MLTETDRRIALGQARVLWRNPDAILSGNVILGSSVIICLYSPILLNQTKMTGIFTGRQIVLMRVESLRVVRSAGGFPAIYEAQSLNSGECSRIVT